MTRTIDSQEQVFTRGGGQALKRRKYKYLECFLDDVYSLDRKDII